MSIATGTGDTGTTSLSGGKRVSKNSSRVEALGAVDELNSVIGVALNYVQNNRTEQVLINIQNDLFVLAAELASETPEKKIEENHIARLDAIIGEIEPELSPQDGFIFPRGTKGACFLHQARTVCRRAERRVFSVENIRPEAVKYLNRLSDVMFILARLENIGRPEQKPGY
jgi:cob(I)alamin adenosyltransferase